MSWLDKIGFKLLESEKKLYKVLQRVDKDKTKIVTARCNSKKRMWCITTTKVSGTISEYTFVEVVGLIYHHPTQRWISLLRTFFFSL